ncbi:MAG: Chromosome segregation ATPase-like protein, partial [Solirubrobacterales bacterium]|nr:Chromosome segregation ATPase-like protein [Solirubrobacterales bacterium]
GATTPLAPRLISAAQRPDAPWLAAAIERLAASDPAAAAKLIVGLLPVQRLLVDGDATYDLTVTELGTFRVLLHAGATTVEPRAEPGSRKEIDFHLEGRASALAEFAAGGLRRRPKNTHFEGSRRRLKRLLKDLRAPIQLPDVARSGAAIEPGLVLAALAAGMDATWAAGHTFTVAWDVTGARGGTWTVRIGEGAPSVEPGVPEGGATATVHVSQAAFLPLLAGFAPPPGEQATVAGNTHAVALLRQWFDHAQGLA